MVELDEEHVKTFAEFDLYTNRLLSSYLQKRPEEFVQALDNLEFFLKENSLMEMFISYLIAVYSTTIETTISPDQLPEFLASLEDDSLRSVTYSVNPQSYLNNPPTGINPALNQFVTALQGVLDEAEKEDG